MNDDIMLDILASKYLTEDERKDAGWQSILFNKLCINLDFEKDMLEERKEFQNHISKLNDIVSEKMKFEIFLINTLANENISTIFRGKLKRLAKAANLTINYEQSSSKYPQ